MKAMTKPAKGKKAAPKFKAKAKPKTVPKPKRAAAAKVEKVNVSPILDGKEPEKPKKGNPNWGPGVSGNPGGMPKGLGEVKKLARQHTQAAIMTLAEIMQDVGQTGSARVGAATALLDRGYGKPVQQVEVGAPGDFSAMDEAAIDSFIDKASMELSAVTAMSARLQGNAFH